MSRVELAWRSRSAARTALDRARVAIGSGGWSRTDLASILSSPAPLDLRKAAARREWSDAHAILARYFVEAPSPFSLAPADRPAIVAAITKTFPDAIGDARTRADRIIEGRYDLLGYRELRFESAGSIDWHFDPVHGRRPPLRFWSTLPYLDPECGDHKIIWELNRHQHWMALGRAYQLTGDARYKDEFIGQLQSWLEANPPLVGINWASMLELGIRSLSWMWAARFFDDGAAEATPWLVDLLIGIDRQCRQIERNLSVYFSPNTHLLGEALALYVAGLSLPILKASSRWTAIGRRMLLSEASRQIGADGVHREQSTHYHRYTFDFYLLALITAERAGDSAAVDLRDIVRRLAWATRLLADDQGRLPHFGDDDGGVAMPICGRAPDDVRDSMATAAAALLDPDLIVDTVPEETYWLVGKKGREDFFALRKNRPDPISSAALADSGYYVSRSNAHHLVFDGGPHGYQNCGHAHADALSLTLAVGDTPFLIDPGTHCYTTDRNLRDRFRSTALHNTLTIDNRSAAVPDGPFRWSTSATARLRRWRTNGAFDYIDGSHDGYAPVEHRRRVVVLPGDLIVVADYIGVGTPDTVRAAAHWHIDPRWRPEIRHLGATFTNGVHRIDVGFPYGDVECLTGDEETGLGWCSAVYGQLEPAATLRIVHRGRAPFWMASVFSIDPGKPLVAVEQIPVWAEAGDLDHALAIKVTRSSGIDTVIFCEPVHFNDGARRRPTWRAGLFETDAAMFFCRADANGDILAAGMVDGSIARNGRRSLAIELDEPVSDTFVNYGGDGSAVVGPPFEDRPPALQTRGPGER